MVMLYYVSSRMVNMVLDLLEIDHILGNTYRF